MNEKAENIQELDGFVPSEATLMAWEAQAHMLAYRNSPHGSVQAESEREYARVAFERVVESTQDKLMAGILSRTDRDIANGQDILQNTYLNAFNALTKFRGDAQVDTWLWSIMLNKLSDYYKRESRHTSRSLHYMSEPDRYDTTYAESPADLVPDEAPEPDEKVIYEAVHEQLRIEIGKLSPKLGTAVVMHYFRGLGHKEIGEILGIPEATSKVRLNRAKEKLKHAPGLQKFFE